MGKRYAVFGHPVSHSLSPRIHAAFARQAGIELEYVAIDAPDFAAALAAFDGDGANVTLPHKAAAAAACATLGEPARRCGVVNTLTRRDGGWHGDNTDGVGLVRDLERNLAFPLKGRRVLLLGAGGAARGVAGALLDAGAALLTIANRTPSRAAQLAERFPGARASGLAALEGGAFDLVVNATSAGLSGEAPELPRALLRKEMLAYDMVYGKDTPFLAAARTAGARACDGTGMLVEQAAESFEIWRGVRPDTAPVLARLRAQ
jgi:shikimate dehydrogenase